MAIGAQLRLEGGIGGGHGRSRRELRDSDVVGMSVPAVRRERHNDVRTHTPQVASDTSDGFGGRRLIELVSG